MSTFTELGARLRSLPLELDDLYSRVIQGLRSRLASPKELEKSRNIFALVAGAGSFGRPLSLEELWEALATPAELEPVLQSKTDPIVSNRVIISSWSDFRRQLGRYCGPLIEVLQMHEDNASPGGKNVLPGDIVHFIHRTVKDFLEKRKHMEELNIPEPEARAHVERLARRYLALCLPQEKPPYWPVFHAIGDAPLEWEKSVASLVEYLGTRILLFFSAHVVSIGRGPTQYFKVAAELMDSMIYPPASAWGKQGLKAVPDHFMEEAEYYPGATIISYPTEILRAVTLGHAVRHACLQGSVTAARNLVLLFDPRGPLGSYTRDNGHVMLNGALAAAIWSGGFSLETRRLTHRSRHRGDFVVRPTRCMWPDGDPFVRLAVMAGNVDALRHLLCCTEWFTYDTSEQFDRALASLQKLTSSIPFREVIAYMLELVVQEPRIPKARSSATAAAAATPKSSGIGAALEPPRVLKESRRVTWAKVDESEVRKAVQVVCDMLAQLRRPRRSPGK